jgi:phospholipase/carboxylesterase
VTLGALHEDLAFAYRASPPRGSANGALVLLHGSSTDEFALIPLAREMAPRCLLLAVRGRVMQDGDRRWFRRLTPVSFDQGSIRAEASAFADFMTAINARHGLDPSRTAFLGYSNGANLVSSVMLLHPGPISRAVLLRAMPVLDDAPAADLTATDLLVIAGERDETYAPFAPPLVRLLRAHGARVGAFTVSSGHEFGTNDARIAREWLAATGHARSASIAG